MKILKYKKLKDNRYSITLDNNTEIKVYDDLIVKHNLLCQKNMDQKQVDEILKENDKLASYYKAIKYITVKMRTEIELKKYLSKSYDSKIVNETIEKIKKDGYINEKLYLESYINDRVNLSNVGPYKIINELCKLGYKEDEVNEYLDRIDYDIWKEKLIKIVGKKINSNHGYGENRLKEKIVYDVSNLGYSKKMIEEILDSINIPVDDKILEKEYQKNYSKLSRKYDGDMLYYQIRNKLLYKGFKREDIENVIEKNRS